jgi:probable phosphoglycerate mutase
MAAAHLIVVRHGETVWNVEGRYQGHLDSPLTDKGLAQSKALARRLAGLPFNALYSSDLGRARQTAEIVGEMTGHSVQLEPRLRERHLGVLQGFTKLELPSCLPREFDEYRRGDPDHVVPQGESARQRYQIVTACFEELARRHVRETIVVVAHGGTLSALLRRVLGVPLEVPRRFRVTNTALNRFTWENGRWYLEVWGDASHWESRPETSIAAESSL